ncbi:MAG: phospholipid carrier-dependent glycosyltransferase [Elusimicrobiota bacterium]|jgi:hypothetical protein
MERFRAAILPGLLLAYAAFCSLGAVDFGWYWDDDYNIGLAAHSVAEHSLLPGRYMYPSLCHDLILLALLPQALAAEPSRTLEQIINSRSFLLMTRSFFAILSCLGLIGVYVIVRERGPSRAAAGLAGALMALSWEIGYHSRFISPNGIMMALAALVLMLVCSDGPRPDLRMKLAALAAGLACGAKYPAGLLLVPVILEIYRRSRSSSGGPWRAIAAASGFFCAAYLLTTPGMLLQYPAFLRDVLEQRRVYGTGHMGYTVVPGLQHLALMLDYLGRAAFSKYPDIALFFFILALAGAAVMLRRDWQRGLVFLSFPILYLGFFACQKVMIVRNLLILFPFLAVLAAGGAQSVQARLFAGRPYRLFFPAFIIILLSVNAVQLLQSAWSVRDRERTSYAVRLSRYVDDRPGTVFLFSARAAAMLGGADPGPRANVVRAVSPQVGQAVFLASEAAEGSWTANRRGYLTAAFGPDDVNFAYYPTWKANDRIVVMPIESALKLAVF